MQNRRRSAAARRLRGDPLEQLKCSICGREHDIANMQIGYAKPDLYLAVPKDERERRCWGNETDYFQIEQSGEYRHFIRGWLPIPVRDREAPFAYGLWIEVPQDRFFR